MVHHVYMTIAKVPNITGGRGTKLRRDGMELPDDAQARNCVQKLSIAVAKASPKQTAFGALRRTTLCTRQRVLGGANESGDGDYESVTMGRAAAM